MEGGAVELAIQQHVNASRRQTRNGRFQASPPELRANVIRMSDVEPEEVDWLWRPYIPRKRLTLVEGNPGNGKTFGTLAIAAAITRGWGLPGVDGVPRSVVMQPPASVLLCTCEDGLADTIRPRLDAAKANVELVFALDGAKDEEGKHHAFTLADRRPLAQALEEQRPALVIIDPIQGFLGAGVDMNAANEVRPLLSALGNLAEEHNCAIVAIRHLRKSASDHATQRGLGSIDFSAAARSILLFAQDPTDPSRYVIAHSKSSLAQKGPSLAFTLQDGEFQWAGSSNLSADDLLRPPRTEDGEESDPETEFLRDALGDGPRSAREVQREAKEAGFEVHTVRRRAKAMGVKFKKGGMREGWTWELPREDDKPTAEGDEGYTQISLSPSSPSGRTVSPSGAHGGPEEPGWLDEEDQAEREAASSDPEAVIV
jgi:hypothetical protein